MAAQSADTTADPTADPTDGGGGGGVRPTHGTESALRLSVVGPDGRLDVAVPSWLEVSALAASYAEELGLGSAPRLATAHGRALDPSAALESVAQQGDLLVASAVARSGRGRADPGEDDAVPEPAARSTRPRGPLATVLLVLAGVCAVGAASVFAGSTLSPGATWLRPAAAAVLLLGALYVALPRPGRDDEPVGQEPWTFALGPALALAAGFVVAFSPRPGGTLLATAVGGLAAVVVAAIARTGLEGEREDLSRVWLVFGGLLAVGSVVALLVGASPLALAAIAYAVAVVATRMLPSFVVDVPDDVLLDLDRLAVTAWSARERPRGGRKRHQVRRRMVSDVVRRSQRTVTAGVVVACVVAVVSGPVVVLGLGGEPTTWARWGGVSMVLLGAASLALVGRTFRSLLPRVLLGATAILLVVVTAGVVSSDLGSQGLWYVFAAAVLVAPAAVLAAVRLGGGWRSVWWARVGEILETATGVLVLALLPLAAGLFDLVRGSVG